jgi:hypothetical protein
MQLTAGRSAFRLLMTLILNLQRHALAGAVADLVSRQMVSGSSFSIVTARR